MIVLPSRVDGKKFDLYKLEQKLKPIGYTIGGNWDYDHGAFDYKIDGEGGYEFLRLPFQVVEGQLDANNCMVELGRPFLLSHEYQSGVDHRVDAAGAFNQFQEPVDEDASFPTQFIDNGKALVQELESVLLSE